MAFVDKITHMRRAALIRPGHVIVWEGVLIEGTYLLKEISYLSTTVTLIKDEDIDDFCQQHGLVLRFQDPHTDEYWEPRKEGYDE